MRESLSLILTLLIAGVLIGGIDFVWRNLDETLDDSTDQLTNGEGLASAGGEATTRGTGGGGPSISAGRRIRGQAKQFTSPSSHDGRRGFNR